MDLLALAAESGSGYYYGCGSHLSFMNYDINILLLWTQDTMQYAWLGRRRRRIDAMDVDAKVDGCVDGDGGTDG
jgi:hypothetical protein